PFAPTRLQEQPQSVLDSRPGPLADSMRHPWYRMRVHLRILRVPTQSHVDGVRVDCYAVGQVYEVSRSLAEVFLAEGWAEPVPPQPMSKLPSPSIPTNSKS